MTEMHNTQKRADILRAVFVKIIFIEMTITLSRKLKCKEH